MNLLRSSLRVALIFSLCVLSPGGSAWAAIGRVVTPAAPRAAVPSIPAGSMNLRMGAALTPLALNAPNAGVTSPLSAAPLRTAPVAAPFAASVPADAPRAVAAPAAPAAAAVKLSPAGAAADAPA
ncbi:MAG: hypothetical protein SF051_05180, partial [Elusimicrobiota bacterium]|nr:hypothetical protein [Elusimicrobiota bacterium]